MHLKSLAVALAVALPLSAHAYKLDRMTNCDLSVQDFFAPLVQARAIRTPADHIAPSGENVFRKTRDDSLTFFNMTVGWLWGYSNDPLLFQHTAGTNPTDNYGFYVQAPLADVQAVMQSIGNSKAILRRVDANATAVVCQAPT
ncbi:hypothetical protein WT29_23300 [Burkholderia stagnalis]|uniref:Uncharacterized protein n=1 Tax=Burkholderia stagnalis TaxID=1503054 RepID=A0A6L3MVS4_9BURK|nr:hypothetical protein [Burkholderia stagnalis]KAB0637256.1 hypothetical protein F7R25_15950 [Burkholderia stagnalis]KVW61778.1 hypothetical protein WT28_15740 [Burkholderia stagnalis]KVW75018.1 hypothetical protein WT29_23300 [Burkholderia stagnalis]KVX78574.1 hypothetical protein WT34_10530 [Burkholderia stagnalis]KWN53940.1 hypothetical protein WT89_23595 [Burkholderia stagnalis]